jgi:hypothetical protein
MDDMRIMQIAEGFRVRVMLDEFAKIGDTLIDSRYRL